MDNAALGHFEQRMPVKSTLTCTPGRQAEVLPTKLVHTIRLSKTDQSSLGRYGNLPSVERREAQTVARNLVHIEAPFCFGKVNR